MKHFTLEDIRKAEQDFIPCPFCKKKPTIVFSDDECNWKDQDDDEYLQDPWSGLCFSICHENEDCPIEPAEIDMGRVYSDSYDTPEEAVEDWNKHLKKMEAGHKSSTKKFNHENTSWIDVEHGVPVETGWYLVYAPEYRGSKYKEFHNGYGFSKFTVPKSGEGWWSIDDHHTDEYIELQLRWRKNYFKEENPKVPVRKYVRLWMPLPPVNNGK